MVIADTPTPVKNQLHIANYFTECLRTPRATVTNHARRNFLVAWFLAQIVQYVLHPASHGRFRHAHASRRYRGLTLWETDHTMTIALDVARTFAPCAEYYLRLWPAPCESRICCLVSRTAADLAMQVS